MSSNAPANGHFFVDQPDTAPAPAPAAPVAPAAPPPAPVPEQPQPAAAPTDSGINAMLDVPLGTLIFRAGLLAEEQLEDALQEGTRTGKRLGEVLLERGWLNERDLGRLLAGQKGLRFVELADVTPDPAATKLLPEEKARMQGALAIGFDQGVPVVAVADPTNELVVENVRRALGVEPNLVVAAHGDLANKIEETYAALGPAAAPPVAAPVEPAPAPAPAAPEAVLPAPLAPAVEPMPTVVPPPEERVAEVPPPVPVDTVPPKPEIPPLVAEPPVSAEVPTPQAPPAVAPLATPEPVLVQQPAIAPQPAPASEGSGLFSEALEQAVAPLAVEPPPTAPLAPPPTPAPAPAAPPPEAPVAQTPTHFVVLRLGEAEQIEIGAFPDVATAQAHAREVVRQIAAAESDGSWPYFADRFLRPATITSVDVAAEASERWVGSATRARWADSAPA